VRNIDGVNYRMGRYKDIYGDDGIKVAKEIKEGHDDKFLMKKHDPETFELLRSIVYTTVYSEKENPFEIYKNSYGFIRKRSKKGLGPIVRSLKYINERLGNHKNITNKYDKNTNKVKVVLLQVSPYRTDFYRSEEGFYKFITIRYANISKDHNGYYIDENIYAEEIRKNQITAEYTFQFSLYRNEFIEVSSDKEKNHMYRFVGTNNDNTNIVEVKEVYCNTLPDKKQIFVYIGKKIEKIQKYHTDVLGNLYKVSNEVLQLKL
jgi:CRISPR-associated endonuclease Csn1